MGETVIVSLYGSDIKVSKGISIYELSKQYGNSEYYIVAAKVNNQLCDIREVIEKDSKIEFVDLSTSDGFRIYIRSLNLVLIRAAKELFDGIDIRVEHSIGKSIYCDIIYKNTLSPEDISKIRNRMREIIDNDEIIDRVRISKEEALKRFLKMGQTNKYNVLKYRKKDNVNLYTSGAITDYFYGYMVPSTGYLKAFDLQPYENGMVLMLIDRRNPLVVAPFRNINKLFKIYHENKKWGKILQVGDVGELNKVIEDGNGADLIRVAEALQEKKIAEIADKIVNSGKNIRLVTIAGPSSSGKTTTAQRLSIQLRVNGLKPIAVSLDDYFINRDDTPLDEYGNRDFESIDALDLKLFNEQLKQLLDSKEVEIPIYNFKTGMREEHGNKLKINSDEILIIEGIHGLNERLTESIPRENKFKLYVSALTQIRYDNYNRIPTTDSRIIRRMVRDFQFRGYSAVGTIDIWPSVRRGEEKNIFPYQEEADSMFNTALVYELSVLKALAMPLLEEIGPDLPQYAEATRLKNFLSYFVPLDPKDIPANSIIREFVGGSCFFKEH